VTIVLASACVADLAAQNTFHIYVDPIYGDDAAAFAANPGATLGNALPLDPHPSAAVPGIQGQLQHAPFSFRTLTGAQGVLAYLNAINSRFATGPQGLPWFISNNAGTINWVVVHCLPGIYGPQLANEPPNPVDVRSGLRFNGETWPFGLPDRVSLQGTSALDTIFDARNTDGPIVRLNGSVTVTGQAIATHRESMIDGLTIRGCRSNGEGPGAPPNLNSSGAGIFLARNGSIGITISNCFIIDNAVGVAVDNTTPGTGFDGINVPKIINCTFARNQIALWNGGLDVITAGQSNLGVAEMTLLNDVFDSWLPGVPPPMLSCPFAGVSGDDLTVQSVNTPPVVINLSFCAWEQGRPAIALSNWQPPTPGGLGTLPPPRVDLMPITGTQVGSTRQSLYVNDLLRLAAVGGAGVDYSPHDFRLSPIVGTNAAQAVLNPLVNQGLWLGDNISVIRWPLRFGFGPQRVITLPPGLPAAVEPLATLHAWDWDCEGFGNPRAAWRSGFPMPNPPPLPDTRIDIGADELGELVLAGYIDGTRIYSRLVPATAIPDHTRMFFVNLPNATYARPARNRIVGRLYPWWGYATGSPFGAQYTTGLLGSLRAAVQALLPRPTFMRNLECDISPHLWPDPHSLWAVVWEIAGAGATDIFGSSPWYTGNFLPPPFPFIPDNAYLYYNPPGGTAHQNNVTTLWFVVSSTQVLLGMTNAPGSGFHVTPSRYLSSPYPLAVFGPYTPCTGTSSYQTDAWGLGDTTAGCPDIAPFTATDQWLGIRFNCQDLPIQAGWENLQTFLTINGNQVAPPGNGLDPERSLIEPRRHAEDVEAALRRARNR